ncbi:hypothetical protein [Amphritea balenae]|uniref:Uncharacterized protein n=1 Tax=Amphritea balenae TaxID=452629 RepID=A0A3P1SXP7_9GAMM|nr:hypothetical protein [Amphritea balenae]RRD01326.1 hypothetical protein EHS89_01835 [Amphritea balenae]GGK58112.1 hypothetical protein GCM10007941_05290 [Amphritea balenae]
MGGVGSGYWYRVPRRIYIEDTLQLDIRDLKRQGVLNGNGSGMLSWPVKQLSAEYSIGSAEVVLKAPWLVGKQGQHIFLSPSDCNFGGQRQWFECGACFRRVASLCCLNGLFRCRHCYCLPYRTQGMTKEARQFVKLNKLEQLIFDRYDNGFRCKKYGMHWKTYMKLMTQYVNMGGAQ